jgi:hypothetical protein
MPAPSQYDRQQEEDRDAEHGGGAGLVVLTPLVGHQAKSPDLKKATRSMAGNQAGVTRRAIVGG